MVGNCAQGLILILFLFIMAVADARVLRSGPGDSLDLQTNGVNSRMEILSSGEIDAKSQLRLLDSVVYPVKTTAQRDALSLVDGLGVFNTDTDELQVYDLTGAAWRVLIDSDSSQSLQNKTINAALNSISNITDSEVSASAAITRTKLANGTVNHVLINDGSGVMSSEAQLAKSRGGTGADNSSVTFPATGTIVTEDGAATLTNKTIAAGSNTISGLTHGTEVDNPSSGVHGVTGNVVGTTDVQDLSNKVFIDQLTVQTGTEPASPDLGDMHIFCLSADKKCYKKDDTGAVSELGAGGGTGQGAINYITNFGAEDDLAGWATFDDGAFGGSLSGGTVESTLNRNTTNALREVADFQFVKATTGQYEGFSYQFDLDPADAVSILRVSFDYNADDSLFDDNDMRVVAYDTTGAQSVEVIDRDIVATANGHFEGYFQVPAGSTQMRIGVQVADAVADSYTVYFDNFFVGPESPAIRKTEQLAQMAYVGSDSLTASTDIEVPYNTLEHDTVAIADTVNGRLIAKESGYYLTGYTIGATTGGTAPAYITTSLRKNGSSSERCGFDNTPLSFVAVANTSYTFSNSCFYYLEKGDYVSVWARSQTQTSTLSGISGTGTPTDFWMIKIGGDGLTGSGKVIAFSAWEQIAAASAPADNTDISIDNILTDNTNSYDSVNNYWKTPESGYYQIQGCVNTINMAYGFYYYTSVYKDGVKLNNVFDMNQRLKNGVADGSQDYGNGGCSVGVVYLNKDENISLRITPGGKSINASEDGSLRHKLSIHKVEGGGSAGAPPEKIRAKYIDSISTSYAALPTSNIIDFDTKEIDTHAAVTAGGAWKFTAPRSITCDVYSRLGFTTSNVLTSGRRHFLYVYKNGAFYSRLRFWEVLASNILQVMI